jgi:hypothetical protein
MPATPRGKKKAPPIGGARLTAWRFPKEGRPVFTQSLWGEASEKQQKGGRWLKEMHAKVP